MNKLLLLIAISGFAVLHADPAPADRAWQILELGLRSKSATRRANAAHALRLVRDDPKAQQMVEHALDDPSPKVKAVAARALGPMGAESAVPKLTQLLADADPAIALAAAHSLILLGKRDAVYELDYQMLTGERKGADGFVHSQINQLRDPRAVAMMGVETGIGFVPFGSEGYEVFRRAHKDDGTPVRVDAAKELVADRDPKIDAALARACADKNPAVRAAALFALAKRGDSAALRVIAPALDDRNDVVKDEAAAAVLRISGAQSTNSTQEEESIERGIK